MEENIKQKKGAYRCYFGSFLEIRIEKYLHG